MNKLTKEERKGKKENYGNESRSVEQQKDKKKYEKTKTERQREETLANLITLDNDFTLMYDINYCRSFRKR